MNVTPELLPEHPIDRLVASTTDHEAGIHRGEVVAYRCRECGVADEDCMELIHEDGCQLRGRTEPTAYANRLNDDGTHANNAVATDGGEKD